MNTIWKYPINDGDATHQLPVGAKVLSAQAQYGDLQIWVMCDPEATAFELRTFKSFVTGETFPDTNLEFIDTVQIEGGRFIIHIFEVK
jgi:hypothetical protein